MIAIIIDNKAAVIIVRAKALFSLDKEPNGTCFHCGMLDRIAEKYFGEIKMPYLPEKTKVFDAVTFDSETGEDGCYDTMCIYDMCGKTIYLDDSENSLTKDEFIARYEKYCDIRKSNSA